MTHDVHTPTSSLLVPISFTIWSLSTRMWGKSGSRAFRRTTKTASAFTVRKADYKFRQCIQCGPARFFFAFTQGTTAGEYVIAGRRRARTPTGGSARFTGHTPSSGRSRHPLVGSPFIAPIAQRSIPSAYFYSLDQFDGQGGHWIVSFLQAVTTAEAALNGVHLCSSECPGVKLGGPPPRRASNPQKCE